MTTFSNSTNTPSVVGSVVVGTGTGFSSVGFSAVESAGKIVQWDSNVNLSANNFLSGYASTATAAGTTVLTVGSAQQQYFTGATTQIVTLPVTSTLVLGQSFTISNNSSGVVTVQSSGGNTIQAMAADSDLVVTVINTAVTTAAGWNAVYSLSGGSGSITINTDSGSATGSTLIYTAVNGVNNCGTTVDFTAGGTTVLLNVTDGGDNTFIGKDSGHLPTTSASSTGIGADVLSGLTSGIGNTGVGNIVGSNLLTGQYNTMVGFEAGSSLTSSESSNILINAPGVIGESNALRLGVANGTSQQQLSTAYIAGIVGNSFAGSHLMVVIDPATNQLGTDLIRNSSTSLLQNPTYAVQLVDQVILVDTTIIAATSTISLLAAPFQDGQVWTIKDYSGSAGSFPITVNVTGGGTIDGLSGIVLGVAYQSMTFCWDAGETTYSIVSDYTAGATGIAQLTGDSGTATGASIGILALDGSNHCGGTVKFAASGSNVVLSVSDASNNTFIGLAAGNTTYTGTDNTAIGRSALAGLTSGSQNVAIGQQSLVVNTNGLRNIAIGGGTLNSSITGDDNIMIGTGAGTLLDGSNNNIAIGTSALSGGASANQNIAIGELSLAILNGGTQNIAIGPQAGGQASNGTYNTYLGWSAGFLNDSGEDSNIYLSNPGFSAESNALRIGSATGTGNQELNKAFIFGINGVTNTGVPNLVTIDGTTSQLGVSSTLATAPPASSTATAGYGSLAVGTALQNTLGYDILVNISLTASAAVGATIVLGVGPTNTPTTNAVTGSFSAALTQSFTAVVPAGYYCLVNTTGTITVGSITTQVCPL